MNTDLMVRHALFAGMPGSGKTGAASLPSLPEWTQPGDHGGDSGARHPVTASPVSAACGQQEVAG